MVKVNKTECEVSKCGYCVFTCPKEIFTLKNNQLLLKNTEECNKCEICIYICPNDALKVG